MAYGDLKCRNLIWNSGSGDNTVVLSTLATQSYVSTNFAPKANPTFTGTVTVPTAPSSDVSTKAASTAFVDAYYATKAAPAFTGNATGVNLTLSGNLVVNGTTTTIDSVTLSVKDKNIELGVVSSPSDTTADGGGITLKGASDKTFNWVNATDAWTSSEHIYLGDNKKLLLGVGAGGVQDLQIYSNGSEGILEIPDGGTLKIKDGSNTMATFGGASNQLDIHVQTVFIGASSNASWDKANNRFIGTITEINVTANNSTDETCYPLFVDGATGSQGAESDTGLTYNPSTGLLTSIGFSGSGASLTALNADNISSGTIAAARVPTLNQNTTGSAGSFTAGSASNLNSGTLPAARINGLAFDGSNITNLPASGGVVQIVASGSLTANTAVMVKSDGTVEGISTVSESNGSMGSSSNGSYATGWIRGAFNSSTNKVVVVYQGTYNQYSLKYRVGTVSGTSISWGGEGNVTGGNNEASNPDVIFHPPTGKVLCAYRAQWVSNQKGYATVGTISGNSMTWGSNVQWEENAVSEISCFWDPNVSDRIGIAYTNNGDSSRGKIETALISTTANSCTFPRGGGWGGNTVSASTAARYMRVTKMGDHMAFVYCDQGSSYALRVRGLEWNSTANNGEYQSASSDSSLGNSGIRPDITWDSNYNALVVSYIVSADGSDTFGLKIGAITGTGKNATFSWSSELGSGSNMFSNRTNGGTSIEFDKKSGKIWCVMCEEGLRHRLITLTSTTTINKESIVNTSTTNNSFYVTIANNMNTSDYNPSPTGKYMVFWYDGSGSSRQGRYVVKQLPSTTLDADRYLGIASAGYSNGQTATINIAGGTAIGSSLTPNTNYYVQSNGTIGATAANPSVLVGKAYTSTKILIK